MRSIETCYGKSLVNLAVRQVSLQEFHNGMKAKVVIGRRESDSFDVLVGIKQGCVLAPVIFNLFLVAVTLACRNGLLTDAGVPFIIIYRLDGSLFNLRR